MRTSFKKTYWIILAFSLVLVLTITLTVSYDIVSIYQRETKPVVPAPIHTEEIKSAESNSENSNAVVFEHPKTEEIRSEEIDIGQDNAVLPAETHRSETEPANAQETIADTTEEGSVKQNCSVGERHSLFIGDSRTMGLANYASIENANYFAAIGMSVYNVMKDRVSIPQIGKVTLEELLNYKKYDIIYVMLGVNELGYVFEQTLDRYEKLVEYVMQVQPDAIVILMANIYVTSERSETDKYINNPAIDRFNEATAKLTDNKTVFYLDANILFDDENGNLAKEKSADSAHLKAKYCVQWAEWLEVETAELILYAEGEKGDG